MRGFILRLVLLLLAITSPAVTAFAQSSQAGLALPRNDPPFGGVANRTLAGSKPEFPLPAKAPPGAPNVLLVLIDDAGFGNRRRSAARARPRP
jgi:arylsulfatase